MKTGSMDMCNGPILKKVIVYTLPIIATGILQLLFNAADLIVVGRYCGSVYIGAVGATGSLTSLIVNLFIGLSTGVGVTVAHAMGSNDMESVSKTVHTAIPVALISGVILTAIGVFGSDYFLKLMGTPDDVRYLSATYMRIYFLGITSTMVYNFGSAILRAIGDTNRPLIFLTAAGVINVILNIFFVTVFNMNVDGVALATSISQTVAAALIVIDLMKRTDSCRLVLKKIKIHRRQLNKIMKIGIPAGIQSSLFAISNVIVQSSVNSFGSIVISGNSAAQNIEGFTYTSMNAFSQTAVNFIGQNTGAKKYHRIRKIMWICLACVSVTGIVAGSAVNLLARPLLGIYITDSTEAINYGLIRLAFIILPHFLCGIMDVTTGAIRGLGSSLLPMLVSIAGACGLRILWVYTIFQIPEYHTLAWLLMSYPISWFATFLVQFVVFVIVFNKQRKGCALKSAQPALAKCC